MKIQDVVPGGVLTQRYGWTVYAAQGAYGGDIHDGVDIAAPYGTKINWPVPPSSVRTGWEPAGYGRFTVGYSGPYEMLFGHEASTGNTAYAGLINSTGYSTGNHTHLRVKVNGVTIDPIPWLNNIGGNVGVSQAEYDKKERANSDNASTALNLTWQLMHGRGADAGDVRNWQALAEQIGGMDKIWEQLRNPDKPASDEHRNRIKDLFKLYFGRDYTKGQVSDKEIRQRCPQTLEEIQYDFENSEEHKRYTKGR